MQMNKQGTLSCKNVLSLHKRHWSSHNRELVASQQVTRMFSSKNPDDSLKAHVHSPYIPPTLCISITFMTSLNDIMIVCFPLLGGKKHCTCAAKPCWLTCAPTWIPTSCFSTATHEPSTSIPYPKFPSLWYSPPGILVHPHTWSLKFIRITHKWQEYK